MSHHINQLYSNKKIRFQTPVASLKQSLSLYVQVIYTKLNSMLRLKNKADLEISITSQKLQTVLCVCVYVCVHGCLVAKSCLTLCDPMDYGSPGSSVYGTRILKWVAIVLQGIFPTQVSNPSLLHLLHLQMGSSPLVLPGKPRYMYTYDWFALLYGRNQHST